MLRTLRAALARSFVALVVSLVVSLVAVPGWCFEAAHASDRDGDGPRAVIPVTSFDFGDVYRGEVIYYPFIIRNAGKSDLLIKDFIPTCGCETVEWDRVIPPGKEGQAAVEINTSTQSGNIVKLATIKTNDPDLPSMALTLNANVLTGSSGGPVEGVKLKQGKHLGPVFIEPDTRWGYKTPADGKGRFEFNVSVEKGALNLTKAEADSQAISCKIEAVEPGKQFKIIVEPAPGSVQKGSENTIRVSTDSAQLAWFTLHLRVFPQK